MAFNNANTAANTVSAPSTSNDNWKAAAFLNFYLPTTDGSRRKVGAIPLKAGRALDDFIIQLLAADPEANGVKFMNKLQMEFREVGATDVSSIANEIDL